MISQISEKNMHKIRWLLVIGWFILILSLFYDPISHAWSDPNNLMSPFRDQVITQASDPNTCVKVQETCLSETPYPMGTRFFWGMIVPSAIIIVFVFGHETWRRICPLYFLSQIPRRLGLSPRLNIENNTWLRNNHLYLQFFLFFMGLNARILFVNSARPIFGLFLLFTILSAITIVFLYGGRSWCHYVCPFGMVQMVFTGPRGLLDSKAQDKSPFTVTQSMCRTVDAATGKETSACISCKSACFDIDSEKNYWEELNKPGRKLVQYGYLGLVVGYFIYYYLYSGNFWYYFSGAWTHEEGLIDNLFKPGFYLWGQAIAIPKLVASPLTLALCVVITCFICTQVEKGLTTHLRRRNPNLNRQQAVHKMFSLCTFIAFNAFFIYGGRPEILRLPFVVQFIFNATVVLVSSLWLYRTWGRSFEEYNRESIAYKLRRQLKKLSLDFSNILQGRSLDDLNPDQLEILTQVLPGATQQERLSVYQGVLTEALSEKRFSAEKSRDALKSLRDKLHISDEEHDQALSAVVPEISQFSQKNEGLALAKTALRPSKTKKSSLSNQMTQIRPNKEQ